jgi:hypothetical protein
VRWFYGDDSSEWQRKRFRDYGGNQYHAFSDIFLVLVDHFHDYQLGDDRIGGRVNLPKAVTTQSEARGTTVTLTPSGNLCESEKGHRESLEPTLKAALSASPDKTVI